MKLLKYLTAGALALAVFTGPFTVLAADATPDAKPEKKAKAYTLKTCIVSGEKLGEMGAPYVFVHEGREIKLCCKGCLKDFNKSAPKFVKKIEQAEAKAKKEKEAGTKS